MKRLLDEELRSGSAGILLADLSAEDDKGSLFHDAGGTGPVRRNRDPVAWAAARTNGGHSRVSLRGRNFHCPLTVGPFLGADPQVAL